MSGLSSRLLTPLALAVAGLSAVSAQAVYVSPTGQGQALIYPYYSARNVGTSQNFVSVLALTNSTNQAKAIKIHVRESRHGRIVLGFNLFLAAHDQWRASIYSQGAYPKLAALDSSCTYPALPADANGGKSVDLRNSAYIGDGAGDGFPRAREGYVEIIEMGDVADADLLTTVTSPGTGQNAPCSESLLTKVNDAGSAGRYVTVGSGGLSGNMQIFNINSGESYGYNATALDGFSQVALFEPSVSNRPNLASANPKRATVFTPGNDFGDTKTFDFGNSGRDADPVSAVLMHEAVQSDFSIDPELGARTDMILTFPTKHLLADKTDAVSRKPFQSAWANGKSADEIRVDIFDPQGNLYQPNVNDLILPKPVTVNYATNVISVGSNNMPILGGVNPLNIDAGLNSGVMAVGFPPRAANPEAHWLSAPVLGQNMSPTIWGLPVIGLSMSNANAGSLTVGGSSVLANSSGTQALVQKNRITTP